MKNYTEFCKVQADKLFGIIDQHQGLLQWQKKWQVKGNSGLAKGVGGFYRGVNMWKLLSEQLAGGYGSSIWLTFSQIRQKGGYVCIPAPNGHRIRQHPDTHSGRIRTLITAPSGQ